MGIQNLATGSNKALAYGPQAGSILTVRVDCSKTPLDGSNTKNPIFNIPAGTFVAHVVANVLKADTGASTRTFSIGDSASDTAHLAATNAKTTGRSKTAFGVTSAGTGNAATVAGAGKFYTSANAINLVSIQELTDAVIEVKALCYAL